MAKDNEFEYTACLGYNFLRYDRISSVRAIIDWAGIRGTQWGNEHPRVINAAELYFG